ncbi:hypothetical protein O6H91_10G074900 [Diphasiastrum complanatum]|uniref:Uncharacterized protein n=1 Tax=Diphasiastrum complanatum TaxID=34168 RepID=A0ACC2CID7_DIPCM|nr:hypothetical protein O6H91_10G074900 [Diphasiastrum complanatum]
MTGELLTIQPDELKFIFELHKQISCSVRLINDTYDYVAFKEIPHRAMKIGWDAHTPQDKIDGILKSQRRAIQGVSDGDSYVYEKETLEIFELETLEESIFEEFDPPKPTIKKLPFIKELHKKSSFLLPTCHDTEIDLSPLMSNLLPTSHVIMIYQI